MSRIDDLFEELKEKHKKAFVAYITAGDPNLEKTKEFCRTLASSGVDLIELGVPFSDPLADGPTNQAAAERALASGTDLIKILDTVKELRESGFSTPIVLFSYLNPIFNMGYETFAKRCKLSGVDGVLVLDLPIEEAEAYTEVIHSQDLDTVFLAAPTTTSDRLSLISEKTKGFLYYVSRTGVTGAQATVSDTLESEVENLRGIVGKPIVIGFGISNPDQAKQVSQMGDGIVIGSALVKLIEKGSVSEATTDALSSFARGISDVL
ncbi:MAG: tryptophan synthase subunit alpha [Pseudobacteriovorax sp.]|nr:tryptophan synthase subunit alpha [Pseudobacteriovorax sp.]